MGGKASILMVLGFSLIFLVAGTNFNRMSSNTIDNFKEYYFDTRAYNVAESGANMAASEIFADRDWDTGFSNLPFDGGIINATVESVPGSIDDRIITVTGTYQDASHTIRIKLTPSSFSSYAYFSLNDHGIYWATGDTVWGKMHIEGVLNINGDPVFKGYVTMTNGIHYGDSGHYETQYYYDSRGRLRSRTVWVTNSNPQFLGGLEDGVTDTMPSNGVSLLKAAAASGGHIFPKHDTVFINFQADSIKYRYHANDKDSTAYAPDFAPNGVIFADSSVLHLKGTIKGQYTISVSGKSSLGKGKVFLDDNVVYNTDPKTNMNSTDLLGIVAENNVLIKDNPENHSDIDIYASIYSQKGGFGAENYNSLPISGNINLYGGIIQAERQAVGTIGTDYWGHTYISHGFNKRYRFDPRFAVLSPPHFPGTGKYQIVSWHE